MALWSGEGRSGGTENVCASSILRSSRAARLWSQLLEVTERERRAWVRNRRLLQDFQRAQDTLDELAARTAVMAAIREEYEKQLEQHYPQWQLKFEEGRTAAHQKEVMLLLKEALRKMDENGKREACWKTSKGANTPFTSLGASLLSPSPSHLLSSPILPHKSRNGEDGLHILQKANKAVKENLPLKCPGCSFRWIEAQSRPGVSPSSNTQNLFSSSDLRGFQDFSRAEYQYQQHCQHFNPSYMLPQEQPHGDPIMGYPPGWPGLCNVPRQQSAYSQAPWPGFPIVDPRFWSMAAAHEPVAKGDSASSREERERSEGQESTSDDLQGHKRLPKTSNQSFELDIKPVRLSSARGDSSECSSVCSVAPGGGTAETRSRKRKERKGGMPQKGMNREDATSLAVARLRSSAESNMNPCSGSGIIRGKKSRATTEAKSRKGIVPLSTAPSAEEEGNCSLEEASGSAGTESGVGYHQGSEGHSQRDGGITGEEDEDGEEEMVEEKAEGERKMVVEGGAEHDVPDEEEGSQEEVKGEAASSSSYSVDSAAAGVEGVQEQVEKVKDGKRLKILAKEVDEEDASSERDGSNEEEEETEGEQEESSEEDGGSGEQPEEEEEADEQEGVNPGDSGESERDGSSCSEDGEREEEEESEEGDDAVEEEEETDEEEAGAGEAVAVPADNRKEESEGTTTDSEDEIITSQLQGRSCVTAIRCKTIIGDIEEEEEDDVEDIAEEENHENESDIENKSQDDCENGSDDDIEGILAPGCDSSIPEVPVAEEFEDPVDHTPPASREAEDKASDPQGDGVTPPPGNKAKAQIITVKSKSKALWQDSGSELEEVVPGGTDLTAPDKDDLEDLDDFYD